MGPAQSDMVVVGLAIVAAVEAWLPLESRPEMTQITDERQGILANPTPPH